MPEPLRIVLALVDVDRWQTIEQSLSHLEILMFYSFSVFAPLSHVQTIQSNGHVLWWLNTGFGTALSEGYLAGLEGTGLLERTLNGVLWRIYEIPRRDERKLPSLDLAQPVEQKFVALDDLVVSFLSHEIMGLFQVLLPLPEGFRVQHRLRRQVLRVEAVILNLLQLRLVQFLLPNRS